MLIHDAIGYVATERGLVRASGGSGAGAGALLGGLLFRTERWTPVPGVGAAR